MIITMELVLGLDVGMLSLCVSVSKYVLKNTTPNDFEWSPPLFQLLMGIPDPTFRKIEDT